MTQKINISIPQPCHENWEAMTAVDKGKFCASCEKKVFDFTRASDREIIAAFDTNQNLCGRFLNTQLNRDLVKPNEKPSLWLTTTAAAVSFIGIGTHEAIAQQPVPTEETRQMMLGKFIATPPPQQQIMVKGQVFDEEGNKLAETLIQVKNKENVIYTDKDGFFSVKITKGDILIFSKKEFETQEIAFASEKGNYKVFLDYKSIKRTYLTGLVRTVTTSEISVTSVTKKRTFFGRIFHSIGNWFRK